MSFKSYEGLTAIPEIGYERGELLVEKVKLVNVATEVGTPFYCYSQQAIQRCYRTLSENLPADVLICFAVKANSNVAVIRSMAELGAGADVVSEGEIRRALLAGIPADKIVFSGVGKTEEEIRFALGERIHQLNVESLEEMRSIDRIAADMRTKAPISIRINPDIDAKTNAKITTGVKRNKFGIPVEQLFEDVLQSNFPNVQLLGLSVHIGSQITDLGLIRAAIGKLKETAIRINDQFGHNIRRIDVGGGLGVAYGDGDRVPSIGEYAAMLKKATSGFQVICEPGRALVANAGLLATKVLYTKSNEVASHVVVDAAMNDLIRPALYGSTHRILKAVDDGRHAEEVIVDVVGPICESADVFAKGVALPPVQTGDTLVVCDVGAYGASMSSTYNSRLLVPEVLVNGHEFAVVRSRGTYNQILQMETFPPWFTPK